MIFAFSLMISGCGEPSSTSVDNKDAKSSQKTVALTNPLPAGHPDLSGMQAPAHQEAQTSQTSGNVVNSGIVRETMSAGGYTYAAIEVQNQVIWMAGPTVKLEIGSVVGWKDAALMKGFTSPSLNRTFDQIYFVSSFMEPKQKNANQGIVEEAIPSAGYIYLKINSGEKSVWLAAPESQINVGENISWQGGAVMRNFASTSLNRQFDEIIFVDRVNKEG